MCPPNSASRTMTIPITTIPEKIAVVATRLWGDGSSRNTFGSNSVTQTNTRMPAVSAKVTAVTVGLASLSPAANASKPARGNAEPTMAAATTAFHREPDAAIVVAATIAPIGTLWSATATKRRVPMLSPDMTFRYLSVRVAQQSRLFTARCKFTNPSATHGSDKMITSQTVTENSTCSIGRNEDNANS